MKLDFLKLPSDERRLYIEQAAIQRNISPVIMEKDFFVCWLLSILFESEFSENLVFKGGTSLSKIFGAINRFSEDIDLSLSPTFLGLPETAANRSQADKWWRKAEEACESAVHTQIMSMLETSALGVLGKNEQARFEFLKDPQTKSPVILFHYPSSLPTGFAYIKRSVKLEFGSLTDQQPTGRYPIRPWIAEVFPAAFLDWQCEVVALEIERTFWEKATILHAEYHRPLDKPMRDRFSRHYADTAALANHPEATKAIDHHDLRDRVVSWKNLFFCDSWANYIEAKPGTFRLVPRAERLSELRRDYQLMRDMYLIEPVNFDDILSSLSELEHRINLTTPLLSLGEALIRQRGDELDALFEIAEPARQGKRLSSSQMESILLKLCEKNWLTRRKLAELLDRNEEGLRSRFLAPMVAHGLLCLRYPDKPNRVDQAYAKNIQESTSLEEVEQ